MKNQKFLLIAVLIMLIAMLLTSCTVDEDPGPLQSDERNYSLLDFERIEMGDAFVITVSQASSYSIHARGDRRNLDDLVVKKEGVTLKINFKDSGNRDHTTYIDITMPAIAGVNFSGATNTTISGFKEASVFEILLSGASVAQLNIESSRIDANLSGASKLHASGKSTYVQGRVSGASELNTYNLVTENAEVDASGASKIRVFASKTLKAVANGASVVLYRGNASVDYSASGASTVKAD